VYSLNSSFSCLQLIGRSWPPQWPLSTNRKHDIIMRISQSLQLYSTLLLFLSVFTSAWPWPRFLPDIDSLVVRQQSGGGSSSGSGSMGFAPQWNREMLTAAFIGASQASATNTGSSAPSQTGSSASNSITSAPSSNSGSAPSGSSSGSSSGSGSGSTTNQPTTTYQTSYDPRLPAGGVSMLTPAAISGVQYYKIGEYITFGWNYTSLLATPSAIDIVASCSANKQVYTLAMNQTVGNGTQAVTWDTGAYETGNPTVPLLTETYTLIIYDAASSISAVAQAGYLASFNQFTFGMYSPQPYTPLADGFQCVTCSGALSDMERKALGFMLTMCAITILSAAWFVSGLDIIW